MKHFIAKVIRKLLRPTVISGLEDTKDLNKHSPALRIGQKDLYVKYQTMVNQGTQLPGFEDVGYRVYSEFDEDGVIAFIFAVLGTKSRLFVDIGAGNGIISNCANLAVNFGWHGLFIDGNDEKLAQGKRYYNTHQDTGMYIPQFRTSMVKRENINETLKEEGFTGSIDLLSIDIDGNDYWIWDALEAVDPRVVVVESRIEMGRRDLVVPYDPEFVYPGHPEGHFGASPAAFIRLASKRGYRLVGTNLYGFNLIFVKEDEGKSLIPTITIDDVLKHPRNEERMKNFEKFKDLEYAKF